jgi:nitrogen fixation/metabolism regulation signal transduction histidine kinase
MRAGVVLVGATLAFVVAVLIFRRIRRRVTDISSGIGEMPTSVDQLPLHTYHAVIQQLKQQKYEMTAQQQSDRRRAKFSESISASVLSHLSSGVLFFNTSGLVRQANKAAKEILGFASPTGMSAIDIFRTAPVALSGKTIPLSQAVQDTIASGVEISRAKVDYRSPSNEERVLEVTISSVYAEDASALGVACLFTDKTELAHIERDLQLRGELSAEMALALRASLATISGLAQQLRKVNDLECAKHLATDIAQEAGHLEHQMSGFLAGGEKALAVTNSK